MSWGCGRNAGLVLDALHDKCTKSGLSSNCWTDNGKEYFFEVGRENRDGAITGSIWRKVPTFDTCKKSGSFRIESNGVITTGPKFFKELKIIFLQIHNMRWLWTRGEPNEENLEIAVREWQQVSREQLNINEYHDDIESEIRFPKAKIIDPNGVVLVEYKTPMFVID